MISLPRTRLRGAFICGLLVLSACIEPIAAQMTGSMQETGSPYLQNYTPKLYGGGAQNWAVVQDARGFVYVGNNEGVLEFDGVTWRMIGIEFVRSLAKGADGRIYVGSRGDIGYLAPDSSGVLRFISLKTSLPDSVPSPGDVAKTYAIGSRIAFQALDRLMLWSPESMQIVLPNGRFHLSHLVDQTLFVPDRGHGLMRLNGNVLEPAPDGARFAGNRIYFILPLGGGASLIGTRSDGLFVHDGRQAAPMSTEAADLLDAGQIYHGALIADSLIAIGTRRAGLVVLNRRGKLVRVINSRTGLLDNNVRFVYADDQGGVWLALNNGISRVRFPDHLSRFDESTGVPGSVAAITRFQQNIVVASNQGVYRMSLTPPDADGVPSVPMPQFEPAFDINTSSFDLLPLGNTLLVASGDGIYAAQDGRAIRLRQSPEFAYVLKQSRTNPDVVFAGLENGLAILRRQQGRWRTGSRIDGIDASVRTIVETASRQLWLGTMQNGFYRVSFADAAEFNATMEHFGEEAGISRDAGWVDVFQLADGPVFTTQLGMVRFDEQSRSFLPDSTLARLPGASTDPIGHLAQATGGDIWLSTTARVAAVQRSKGGQLAWNTKPFERLAGSIVHAVYVDEVSEREFVWFGGPDGLVRHDPAWLQYRPVQFSAAVRRVSLGSGEVLFDGAASDAVADLELAYAQNALRFTFAAPRFQQGDALRFQFRLEGFEDNWSAWTGETQKDYTNIPEGSYAFRARAIDREGNLSGEGRYEFIILAPWYRSWWAYVLYLLVFAAIVALSARAYGRYKTRAQAEALEKERLLNEKLQEANQQLQAVDRLKDEFLANTSHELRTPLNGIIGLAESLQDQLEGGQEGLRANVGMIAASGRRLANLVNDILDFSKLKTHHIEIEKKAVDIRVLADVVLKISSPLVATKDVQLENEIPATTPALLGDENRLQQILHNLIGNAIKFTEKGSVRVRAAEKGEGVIEIAVTDTGIGIPEDKQAAIFKSFEQADASTSREYGGTGLGLAITRQLVELHGGRVRVESQPGEGSTFAFTVPIADGEPEASTEMAAIAHIQEPIEAPEPVAMLTDNGRADGIRILVVDDEPINHQVFSNHLSTYGYQILQAMNGAEALKMLEQGERFDLVLLDVMMPRMSGYEVCQKIREHHLPSELPIIMVTAKNQLGDLLEGFSSGANDYLAKPFSKNELLARIRTHLNLLKINAAYGRFVPREFLRYLNKESIVDVQLGDNVQMEMTIFVSDIRSFTTISEKMTPEENFAFINQYLDQASPIIRRNSGFVDRYSGDGIMALFAEKPADAVNAAIETLRALRETPVPGSGQALDEPIQIGIGLHTGSLMLGIVGEKQRAQGDIFSDAVNLANRIEGLSKLYGVSLVVSEQTLAGLQDDAFFHRRFLGQVQVKGKADSVSVYEIYDGDPEDVLELKIRTREDFENGLRHYFAREFTEASVAFNQVLKVHPDDKAAKLYLERSAQYMVQGVPEDWQGIESLTS